MRTPSRSEFRIPRLIVPTNPGLFSAMGLLMTDLKHDYVRTYVAEFAALDLNNLTKRFRELEDEGRELLRREEVAEENMTFIRALDMRYIGQSYELVIPIPGGDLKTIDREIITGRFHEAHERSYGHAARQEPVELVNIRVSAVGKLAKPKLTELLMGESNLANALIHNRKVYFTETDGFVDTPCYLRPKLSRGTVVRGPAIVEDFDSTTVIHPEYQAEVLKYGELLITAN